MAAFCSNFLERPTQTNTFGQLKGSEGGKEKLVEEKKNVHTVFYAPCDVVLFVIVVNGSYIKPNFY